MDRRFVTVLAVSLLFALVVSTGFYLLTSRGGKVGLPLLNEEVVMAAQRIEVGTAIQADQLKLVKVPKGAFPKGGFRKINEVAGRPVTNTILEEEPVTEGRLAAKGAGAGLAPVIPVGMRAVTVRVTDVVGVAGFVQPGLRVDVLVTGRPPHMDGSVTATALQNILVLTSGSSLQANEKGQAMTAQSVTLLVNPEQAEILTLASNDGRIQLVLRNSNDQAVPRTPGSTVHQLYGQRPSKPSPGQASGESAEEGTRRPRPRLRQAAAPPAPAPFVPKLIPVVPDQVVVLNGDKRSVVTFPSSPTAAGQEKSP